MVQVATFSVWKYGFDSRWGDQAALAGGRKTETAAPAARKQKRPHQRPGRPKRSNIGTWLSFG